MSKILGVLLLLILGSVFYFTSPQTEENTIRIGEFSSYKTLPVYAESFRRGWQLAVAEKNAQGGLLGRHIEVIDRDDLGQVGKALKLVEDLVHRDRVDILSGCLFAQVCLAVSEYAEKNNLFHMKWFSHWPDETQRESDASFSTFSGIMQAKAAAQYVAQQAKEKTWVSVSPNHAFGLTTVKAFGEALAKHDSAFTWVKQYWNNFGKLDAGSTVNAAKSQRPDYVLNATLGTDLVNFIRESQLRGLEEGAQIVSIETGMPEVLETLGEGTPVDWIMTGYPNQGINQASHQDFVKAYYAHFQHLPGWMSLLGYIHYQFIFAAVEKAQSVESGKLIEAMKNLEIQTPVGLVKMRAADHVSTLGVWVGKSGIVQGAPKLLNWAYYDGKDILIPQNQVKE